MKIRVNPKLMGASLLGVSPLIKQFGPYPWLWWVALAFAVIGPVFMGLEFSETPKETPHE